MKPWASEFREFIQRGNVIDLAVGIVIGGAFGKIVSSFVGDILMPPIGLLLGRVQFGELRLVLGGDPAAPVTLNYGTFTQSIIDFLIIAFAVFWLVRAVNALRRQPAEAAPAPPAPEPSAQERLLAEIRDLLRARSESRGQISQ